ncbi:Probable bifunctional protein Monooxygenase/ dehydrogenase [Flavobacterium indicum GPTSA100-9 = DSM 17447]|uniref:Probable bifunctional protein Monooxygenase/ dehydrogenase n=1 Tax=Flavobacterium indicum (strain DSM 17447 / CIP 109464 / GPTSA100-9) TaxID=1094466 RepID=H8XP48_FLAIG|nr:bifunctional protein Monooxygenase/ dehydrogenase [Flavobacterium indicum]CCG52315.1 Probable bifunctional protein Monooxygenase/ dehydrogenase [Flavobacterium indicum GPTSA100-9 = DSM 17447]
MKITVIGGGPGGLYFSILTKKAMPHCQIDVYERNKPDDSFGFGVVFSDETLGEFLKRDMESYELIRSNFAYWDDIIIARDGEEVSIAGNGFCGCSRKTLLKLLHQRCREEGVSLHFEAEIPDESVFADSDIILAADGIGSAIRTKYQKEFGTQITLKKNRFVWLGSTKPLDAFTYFFRTTPHGVIVAHSYQYEPGMSTWIFECSDETWQKHGFEVTNEQDTISKIQELFKEELDGHPLISNKSHWRQFPHVVNKNWYYKNIVLLGDAKATAHYSIGSGTKLAMDCAIGLSDAVIANPTNVQAAFQQYEAIRRNPVEMIQYAALVSLDWFENMDRNNQHPFYQFAFGCMTRSKKVTYENLQIRDKSFTDKVLKEFNMNCHSELVTESNSTPAAFTTFKLRDLEFANRIVMAPMGQYKAVDGIVNDWHFQHYSSRALGGVGLILTEMTAISETGRITESCAGIYTHEQIEAWKRITAFVHSHSKTKIGIQIGHSGRKGATLEPWKGNNQPMNTPWELVAASALPFKEEFSVPKEMSVQEMAEVKMQFKQAAINAEQAGFDMIELQAHHGFLLASFLSPLTNIRTDEFGGTIENRLKYPLEVFKEMRSVFPNDKPMSVRISAADWAEGGISEDEVLVMAQAFKEAGADVINVSTGNTVANQNPVVGRMWQTPFSDAVRNSIHIPTITAGYIQDIDQINTIILNGRADLVALGRPLLLDPYFVRNAQAYENFKANDIDVSYQAGISHLYPLKASERKQMEGMKKALKPKSNKK